MGVHIHRALQQAQPDARHHGGTGPGAAGQGFARAALEHPQPDVAGADHLHEARIHPVGECRMALDQRPQHGHGRGVHIGHHTHSMRVAHGHSCNQYSSCL